MLRSQKITHCLQTPAALVTEEGEDEDDFETNPPHICYNGQCLVYMQHAARMRVTLSLIAPEPLDDNSTDEYNWCTYRTGGIIFRILIFFTFYAGHIHGEF